MNAIATATDHERALAWAHAQIGRHEIPNGSNSGPFVELCQRATWLPGTGWPWCVAFFIEAWKAIGVTLPWLGAGAYAFLDWALRNGCAVPLERAVPGDAVILNIGAGHCAMLALPYDQGGGNVYTIDGNWGNAVAMVTHRAVDVRGCVHVHESLETRRKVKPARPHVFEVATSASGHRKVVYVSGRRAIAGHIARLLNRFPRVTITPRGGGTT